MRQKKDLEAFKEKYQEVVEASAFDIRDYGIHDPKGLVIPRKSTDVVKRE